MIIRWPLLHAIFLFGLLGEGVYIFDYLMRLNQLAGNVIHFDLEIVFEL